MITVTQPYTAELLIKDADGLSDFELLSVPNVLFVSYKCSTCGQHCTEHSILQNHMRIHNSPPNDHDDRCGITLLKESTYLQTICATLSTGVCNTGDVDDRSGDVDGRTGDVDGETDDVDGRPDDVGETDHVADGETGGVDGEAGEVDDRTGDGEVEINHVDGEISDVNIQDRDNLNSSYPAESECAFETTDAVTCDLSKKKLHRSKRTNEGDVVDDDDDDDDGNGDRFSQKKIKAPGHSGSEKTAVGNQVKGASFLQEDLAETKVKISRRSGSRAKDTDIMEHEGLLQAENLKQGVKDEHGYAKLSQGQHSDSQLWRGQDRDGHGVKTEVKVSTDKRRMATRASKSRLQSVMSKGNITVVGCENKFCHFCGKTFSTPYHLQRHLKIHGVDGLYKCTKCNKSYARLRDLTYHLKVHPEEIPQTNGKITEMDSKEVRPHICNICGEGFPTSPRLRNHQINHKTERPYKCGECGRTYKRKGDLAAHRKEHKREKPFKYDECNQQFVRQSDLRQHVMNQGHAKQPSMTPSKSILHTCSYCDKEFKTATRLKKHKLVHQFQSSVASDTIIVVGGEDYICNFCKKNFSMPTHLQRHLKSHGVDGLYKCTRCDMSYKRLRDLNYHLKAHPEDQSHAQVEVAVTDKKEALPHICDICGAGFPTATRLRNHETNHKSERPFKCCECSRTYKRKGDLAAHMKEHKGGTPFKCDKCDQGFIRRSYLRRHMMNQGHGNNPSQYPPKPMSHVCSYCDKAFKREAGLKRHQRVHTGEKPFLCTICARSFSHSYSLALHMKYHSGIKPHQCPHCGKCFVQKGYFKTHVKSHSGEPTCQCSVCGQLFKWAVSLKVHMRIHTGERPYQCSYCGRSFTTAGAFQAHVRTHTGEKPFSCGVCGKSFLSSSKLCRHKKTHGNNRINRKPKVSRPSSNNTTTTTTTTTTTSGPTPTPEISVLYIYQCTGCEIFYEREEDLSEHYQKEHSSSDMISLINEVDRRLHEEAESHSQPPESDPICPS